VLYKYRFPLKYIKMREKEFRIEITITGECVNCIEFTVELLKGYKKLCLHLDELKRLKDTLKC